MSRTKLLEGELSQEEKLVAEYLEENASDVLVEKINNGDKGIKDCWSFILNQAKEYAEGNKAVGIADMQVFGWAIHYFEEDSIKKGKTPSTPAKTVTVEEPMAAVPKKEHKAEPKKPKEEMFPGQMTIFDLMGGANDN